MKDLYYRAAAELTVASNSGWEYLASTTNTKINEVKDKKEIAELPIFVNVINPLLKTAAFFVILLAGWRLITILSSKKANGNIIDAIRSVVPLLLVAVILWDFTIVFSIVNVVQGLASNLGGSLDKLTD
jgi:ABC-type polysaccharide/polyol phosphate export permease